MDLYGANFELLSALKPCSLLCAANDVCRLHLTQALVPAGAVGGCKEAEEWVQGWILPRGAALGCLCRYTGVYYGVWGGMLCSA